MFFVESILPCWRGEVQLVTGEVWFACICDCSGAESFNCVFNLAGMLQKFQVPSTCNTCCAFQKHKNSENQKQPS